MKKLNILYLRTDLSGKNLKAGGSVAHTLGIIGGFRKLGHRVVCASSTMLGQLERLGLDQLVELSNPSWMRFLGWRIECLLSNLFFPFQACGLLRKNKIDLIYQRYSLLNFTGLLLSWWYKVPLTLEYNGSEVWVAKNWSCKGRLKVLPFLRLLQKVEDVNLRRADRIISVSQVLYDELQDRGFCVEKVKVVPNGVDTEGLSPDRLAREREQVRKELGLNGKFVFGFIGTFSHWHGVDTMAKMIPTIVNDDKKAHFLLMGDGPLLRDMTTTFRSVGVDKQNVTFTGALDQGCAKRYLAACDAFLCPTKPNSDGSRFFGSPTKLFEYMSLGKPVIASDIEQLSDIFKPAVKACDDGGDFGFLVKPGDAGDLVVAAKRLTEELQCSRHKLGAVARRIAVETHDWREKSCQIIRG